MLRTSLHAPTFFAPDDGTGAGGDQTGAPTGGTGGDPPPAGDEAQLGDAGKKALDSEREARRAAERAANEAKAAAKKLEDELAQFRDANKSETERAIETARKEADAAARSEVTTAFEQRLLESSVLVRAAGKLADPTDAVKLIPLADLAKSEAGAVEDKTIDAAIADLVKQKPYLATGAKPGPGDPDGGRRGTRPAQLTQADLKGMSSEAIVKAKSDGQLNDLLGAS